MAAEKRLVKLSAGFDAAAGAAEFVGDKCAAFTSASESRTTWFRRFSVSR